MKFSAWLLFSIIAAAIAALWLISAFQKVQTDFTLRQHAYHVAVQRHHLSIMIFSIVPEEEGFRTYSVPLWPAEAVAILLSGGLGWALLLARRRAAARGFPVTPLPKEEPADSSAGS